MLPGERPCQVPRVVNVEFSNSSNVTSMAATSHGNGRRLMHLESIRQPKYGYARARSELKKLGQLPRQTQGSQVPRQAHGSQVPRHTHGSQVPRVAKPSANSAATRKRFLTKEDKGWSWLSVQMRDVASEVKTGMARKGELPAELVEALWGRQGMKGCCRGTEAIVEHCDQRLEEGKEAKGRKNKLLVKRQPETLMEVLLQKWVYFDHSHSNVHQVEKHVHAKYCEKCFGHFLLPDGRQVHGSYCVPLSHLVQQLRKLLTNLKSKIVTVHFEDLPVFQPPEQELVPEFVPPAMKPLPQLYPIPGLLPVPTQESEGIGPELPLPVFEPPVPKETPSLQLPVPLRAPPLKLPAQPVFPEDEKTIDKAPYKQEPLPVYRPPEKIPLPEWHEPKLLDSPSEPVPVKATILPMPVEERMPPFIPPIPDLRPCQKSYYPVEDGSPCLCEGQCLLHLDKYLRKGKACQAKPPALIPLPMSPFPLPLQLKPEPNFIPPEVEQLPNYEAPTLKEKPAYEPPPPPVLLPWKLPVPPEPIGWLSGQRPVFLVDCSGTMTRGGFKLAQDVLVAILSPGGQVDVGASHFDIIMYSFDTWSFAATNRSRLLKPEEALQENTPAALAAAMDWVNRWKAGGSTNLLKALDTVLDITFCDCVYLLTDGKPDKPVLVLQRIQKFAKMQGTVVPIFTIGLASTRYGERVLQRISEATGARMKRVDTNWYRQAPQMTDEELEDMLWARAIIEGTQKNNIARGVVETIEQIEEKVQAIYDKERNGPRIDAYEEEKKRRTSDYGKLIRSINAENEALLAEAKRRYDKACESILENNRQLYERAEEEWRKAVEKVQEENQQAIDAVERWKLRVKDVETQNAQLVSEAKVAFERDVSMVDEANATKFKQAREEYDAEFQFKRNAYQAAVKETQRKQKEIDDTVISRNKANRESYEKRVAEVNAANVDTMEKAQADYAARTQYVESENARIKKEAEDVFNSLFKKVVSENERRAAALQKRIQDIRQSKAAALEAYQAQVAFAMGEHDTATKQFAALNKGMEDQARQSWKAACDVVAAQNLATARIAAEEFDEQTKLVYEANTKRSAQMAALMRRRFEVERKNEAATKTRKMEWKQECERAEAEYEVEVQEERVVHEQVCREIERKNAEMFQAASLEHQARVTAVGNYNESVRSIVEEGVEVRAEVGRVEKFIRYVASACVGTNQAKATDDLNVLGKTQQGMETTILIEALQEAYGTKNPEGGYVDRASFYTKEQIGFSGMIPIHPVRVATHLCADLDKNVREKFAQAEQLRKEQELKAALEDKEHHHR